jgi:hypothetical protein
LDEGRLVRAVVVQDEMHVEVLGDGGIDGVEELAELDRAMLAMAVADHLAACDVQRGEEDVVPWRR